jgi:hypothetical protein
MNEIYDVLKHRLLDRVVLRIRNYFQSNSYLFNHNIFFTGSCFLTLIRIRPHFFLSKYLFLNHGITHYDGDWFRKLFFHKVCVHFCGLVPVRNKCLCICLVGTMHCTAHVDKFSMRESHYHQSQISNHGLYLSGLQKCGNMMMLYLGSRVNGISLSSQILLWLP